MVSINTLRRYGLRNRASSHTFSDVNLSAFADLLNRYESDHAIIHSEIVESGKRADTVASLVDTLKSAQTSQFVAFNRFHKECMTFSGLVIELQTAKESLESLLNMCEDLDRNLMRLEDLRREQELDANMAVQRLQLLEYERQKKDELETMKVVLAAEHAHRVRGVDQKRTSAQQALAEEYDKAFKTDLALFQSPVVDLPAAIGLDPTADLQTKLAAATFETEADKRSLEEFLGTSEMPASAADSSTAKDDSSDATAATHQLQVGLETDRNIERDTTIEKTAGSQEGESSESDGTGHNHGVPKSVVAAPDNGAEAKVEEVVAADKPFTVADTGSDPNQVDSTSGNQ